MLPAPMPVDTSLSTPRTDEVLGIRPFGIVDQLDSLRRELETGRVQPLTPASATTIEGTGSLSAFNLL